MANAYAAPSLPKGIGTDAEVDQANQFLRAQPWYQNLLKSWGQGANVKLSDDQRKQLLAEARNRGVGISDDFQIDDSGNIRKKGSLGKKIAIGAGLGAAALTGLGAAGIGPLSGLLGAGGASAGTAAGSTLAPGVAEAAGLGSAAAGSGAAAAGGIGAGTAAQIAGGATAGLNAARGGSWLSPVLNSVLPVAGNIVGGIVQSNAEKAAAEESARAADKALEFEKGVYSDTLKRLDPYIQAGGAASDRMTQLLGLPARAQTTATAPPTYGPSVSPYAASAPSSQGWAVPPANTVTLQAPDGSTKAVPADQAQHFLNRGATLVGRERAY